MNFCVTILHPPPSHTHPHRFKTRPILERGVGVADVFCIVYTQHTASMTQEDSCSPGDSGMQTSTIEQVTCSTTVLVDYLLLTCCSRRSSSPRGAWTTEEGANKKDGGFQEAPTTPSSEEGIRRELPCLVGSCWNAFYYSSIVRTYIAVTTLDKETRKFH